MSVPGIGRARQSPLALVASSPRAAVPALRGVDVSADNLQRERDGQTYEAGSLRCFRESLERDVEHRYRNDNALEGGVLGRLLSLSII